MKHKHAQGRAGAAADPGAAPCPCGRPETYAHCCGRWHAGPERLLAPDAEALMRSRYSAYVLGLRDYLLATWHPSTRPADGLQGPDWQPATRWLGLEVRRHRVLDEQHAEVEFVARSRLGGRAMRLHEVGRFVREAGRWSYLDDATDQADTPHAAP